MTTEQGDIVLTRLLRGAAAPRTSAVLFFLSDKQPSTVRASLDRGAMTALAGACAAALVAEGVQAGDLVILAVGTGPAFVGWLLGAMWIGAVPVPVPVPTSAGAGAGVERFEKVVAHAQPRAIVGEERALAVARHMGASAALVAGASTPRPGDHPPVACCDSSDERIAFVQYTAGSTGAPKGVVVTFANLRANLEAIGHAVGVGPDDRVVSWLPLFHDMGLVGTLLFALWWDVPLYLSSPASFVLRPASWLHAISLHRGTLSAAPHFAYSLCAFKLRKEALTGVDLSSWRLALDGAEPIRAENARAFTARFAAYGLRREAYHPVYGLSEATLAVSFPAVGDGLSVDRVRREALARGVAEVEPGEGVDGAAEIVSVGRPLDGMRVDIRSLEDGGLVPERTLGEIWVSGGSLSPRYLGESGPDRAALRTGDLGYMADGALYVAARLKDVIIQGGANVYPTDIEAAASTVAGVRGGRIVAFGVPRAAEGTEDVAVAVEVLKDADVDALPAAIRAAVQQRCGVVVGEVVLLSPGTIPVTTSGKLMRSRVRESHVAGTLADEGVAEWVARVRRRSTKPPR